MTTILKVKDIHELQPVSVGEVRHWFQRHPTMQSCVPKDLDTRILEKIMRFMGWLALHLEDEHYGRDQAVNELASMQKCSRALAWLWIHSENVSDEEMVDRSGCKYLSQQSWVLFRLPSKQMQERNGTH
jgi:hypothetical protein